MSSKTVYDAIKARLVDQLGGSYPIRDWEEVETQLQQATAPWISIEDGGGVNILNSIGTPDNNWVTDDGTIDTHVFVPSTGSMDAARSICAEIRDVMMYQHLTLISGRLRVIEVDPPDTAFIHSGLWHSMRVSISYSHQYARATAA